MPLASVTFVSNFVVPVASYNSTVTPDKPVSPASCLLFPLASVKTKSPIVPLFGISPASTVILLRAGSPTGLEASIVIFADFPVASASESVVGVPAPVGEKVEPVGLSNITKYIPDGTMNSYLPSSSVIVEVIITPFISVNVTLRPTIFVSPAS